MCRGQTGAELASDFNGLVGRQPANSPQQRVQILTVDVFHRQVRKAFHFAEVVNPADIDVRHLACDAHLVVEAGQSLGIARHFFRQELERNRLAQP